MLAYRYSTLQRVSAARRQGGVVMLVALIVLVVMTLAGIALMRSMDTSTMIAGNMAFKQAATQAADVGIESAIAYLEQQNTNNGLYETVKNAGYSSQTLDNKAYLDSGKAFWAAVEGAGVCHLNKFGQGCIPAPEANANGNLVSYSIQRLCLNNKQPDKHCAAVSGTVTAEGNSEGAQEDVYGATTMTVYYRITVRVVGPRNSVSYVQSIVAL